MQECVKFLKKEISDLNDQNTKKDIEILSLQKELKDVSRQRNQLEESVKKLKEGKRQNNYTEEDAEDNKLLKLEIQSLQKKLANYEKQHESGKVNDYNPEFLKLQCELNEKVRENMLLQKEIDDLKNPHMAQENMNKSYDSNRSGQDYQYYDQVEEDVGNETYKK